MSYVPPLFKNIGKSLKDLIDKKFEANREIKVKTASSNGLTFESTGRFNSKSSEYNGNLKTTYKRSDLGTLETELDTEGKAKGSFETDKLTKGLVTKISGDQATVSVDAAYRQEKLAAQAVLSREKQLALEASVVLGHDGISVGLQSKYDINRNAFIDYNTAVDYVQGASNLYVKTSDSAENVNVGFIRTVSSDLSVGVSALYGISGRNQSNLLLTGVASYTVDRDTTVKGKVDSTGNISGAIEQRLANPQVKYGMTAQYNANNFSFVPGKYGLSLGFGDL